MLKEKTYIFILIAVTMFLFLFGLGNMALTDPDESFYAETAKEMYDGGEWVTPQIFGKPQFEKPVFYYWTVIAGYIVFGVGEFAARFSSALFGILGVIGVYFLGRLVCSPLCGFLSGLILATSGEYLVLARACITDMVLCVFILFSILFFLYGFTGRKRVFYFWSSVMMALAVLTKGPIGIFLPVVILFFYIAATKQLSKCKEIPFFKCAIIFIAVALPWYLAAYLKHGAIFIEEFFGFQNITRFLQPEHKIGTSPLFYIPVILGGFYPWTFFLPLGIRELYKNRAQAVSAIKNSALLLSLWFLVIFIFFSVSKTKLVTYVFPLFPVLAVVCGVAWDKFFTAKPAEAYVQRYMKISFYIFAAVSLAFAIGCPIVVKYEYPVVFNGVLVALAIFSSFLILSLVTFLKGKKVTSFSSIIIGIIVIIVPLALYVLPKAGEMESSREMSSIVKEKVPTNEALGGEDDHRRGIAFYANRIDIVDIHPYQSLIDFIYRNERVWGIIQKKHFTQIKREKGDIIEEVADRGKYVLFTNKLSNKK
ncbi:MAG: glycosyltransferase family 39 protein [Candidatus Omnitrophica bacterium]|nr:glycosyltransferase family 39 protein [Candidatus Omnitrophota bacterium]